MKKMNILFTVWGLSYGGAERFVLNLAKNLDKDRYNVFVFSDNQKKGPMQKEFEESGAKVIYANCHRFRHPLKYKKQIKKVIIDNDIDIIHANDDLNMFFPLIVKPRGVSFVAHSHNTKFWFTSSKIVSMMTSGFIARYITKYADARLACGKEAGKGLFGKKSFTVVHNGIELKEYTFSSSKREKIREKYSIEEDEIVFLNIGRLNKQKNQEFLIDVFSEYNRMGNKSKLFILGDGVEKEALQKKIKALGMEKEVFLLPGQNEVVAYYDMADVFIMPSLFEGMPVVSVEAQANGLKCVFSDTITREADHVGNAEFISLTKSPKQWAKQLERIDIRRGGGDYDRIKEYDISEIVSMIKNIYLELNGE